MATRTRTSRIRADRSLSVRSPAFQPGERIPEKHTADGENVSPPLDVANLPDGTVGLAVIIEDLDAPSGVFTHWCAWNLPPEHKRIEEGVNVESLGARSGRNSFGGLGYRGPEPPVGDPHRYQIIVYALRERLRLEAEVPRDQLEAELAMGDRVLAVGEYMGTYERDSE